MKYLFKILAILAFSLQPILAALIWVGMMVFINLATKLLRARRDRTLSAAFFAQVLEAAGSSLLMWYLIMIASLGVDILAHTEALPFKVASFTMGLIALKEFRQISDNTGFLTGIDIWTVVAEKLNLKKP